MRVWIKDNCPRTVQPLLCLFILAFVSCSSLKSVDGKGLQHKPSLLQFTVNESDFVVFNRQVQELGLVALDFRPAITNVAGADQNEFWITFKFANEEVLMRNYVTLMANGFARRISYSYR